MKRLTNRDMEITKFLSRVKIARPDQIEERFQISRSTAYARLAVLIENGLVASAGGISPQGKVFYATRKGNRRIKFGLPTAKPTVGAVTHDLAMTTVVAGLESNGFPCMPERELRGYRTYFNSSRFQFLINDYLTGRYVNHSPDIIFELEMDGPFIAIEVELSNKNVRRWRDILRGFNDRTDVNGFIGVLYIAHPNAGPDRIERIAKEVGLDDRFQLRLTTDPIADITDGLFDLIPNQEGSSWMTTRKAA